MNKKYLIAGVVTVIALILIALLVLGNTDITLEGSGSYVTVPNTYELDVDKAIAQKDDVTIMYIGIIGSTDEVTQFYKALEANGKSSGYTDIKEDTINGFKVYEYSAKVADLKLLKHGSATEWKEYTPENLTDSSGSRIECDHFRKIYYISPNNSVANELTIAAKNPETDLNTDEINNIIHSVQLSN